MPKDYSQITNWEPFGTNSRQNFNDGSAKIFDYSDGGSNAPDILRVTLIEPDNQRKVVYIETFVDDIVAKIRADKKLSSL